MEVRLATGGMITFFKVERAIYKKWLRCTRLARKVSAAGAH
jgi:hypothetical protein